MSPRVFQLSPSHPIFGDECRACGKPFEPGQELTFFILGPGDDPEEQAKCQAGQPYTGIALFLHAACAGVAGGTQFGPEAHQYDPYDKLSDAQFEAVILSDHHQPPAEPISPAVEQFIADEGKFIGLEAWQSLQRARGLNPYQPGKQWQALDEEERTLFNTVTRDVLEDFAIWYDAGHYRQPIPPQENGPPCDATTPTDNSDIDQQFERLHRQWVADTLVESSLTKIAAHPAYQAIIEMGKDALPRIFQSFEREPDHWILALTKITGETVGEPGDTFEQARQAWLMWGRSHGYLAR